MEYWQTQRVVYSSFPESELSKTNFVIYEHVFGVEFSSFSVPTEMFKFAQIINDNGYILPSIKLLQLHIPSKLNITNYISGGVLPCKSEIGHV